MSKTSDTVTRLHKTGELVETFLRLYPATRDDDFLLYAYVMNSYGYSKNTSFWTLRDLVIKKKLPSMESVGRCRRKKQELYPELQAVEPVEKGRRQQEPQYKEYVRSCD